MLHPSTQGPQNMLSYCIFNWKRGEQPLILCRSLIAWSLLSKLWSLTCATSLILMAPRCGWTTAMLRSQLLRLQLLQAQIGSARAAVQSTSPGGCAVKASFMSFLPWMPQLSFVWLRHAPQLDLSRSDTSPRALCWHGVLCRAR